MDTQHEACVRSMTSEHRSLVRNPKWSRCCGRTRCRFDGNINFAFLCDMPNWCVRACACVCVCVREREREREYPLITKVSVLNPYITDLKREVNNYTEQMCLLLMDLMCIWFNECTSPSTSTGTHITHLAFKES